MSKFTRPVTKGVMPRERLFKLLDTALERPACWVSSQGGAGKTTLVADYLQAGSRPVVWYQVDKSDDDIASFFHFMGQATRHGAQGRRLKPLPRFAPEHLPDIQTFSRRYFEAFFARIPNNCAVVLDDCQEVDSQLFFAIINQCLEVVPPGISIILISRDNPHNFLARMVANGRLARIGWESLRLDESETDEFIRTWMSRSLPKETSRLLHVRSEGWVAGLLLILEHVKRHGLEPSLGAELAPAELFHYFAAEVFGKREAEVQDFLLKTAILPTVAVPLARRLTGNDNAGRILAELAHNNFFITRQHSSPEGVYQYHQLFRDFLLTQARETWRDDQRGRIVSQAASLLKESGDSAGAVRLYISSSDWEAVARLLRDQAGGILSQGRSETVREWLEALPDNLRENDAELLMIHGLCLMSFNPVRSQELFRKSFLLHRQSGDRRGMFLAWAHCVDVTVHHAEFSAMADWLHLLDELLEQDPSFPSYEIEARVVMSTFNAMSFRMPDHPDISLWHERAYNLVLTGHTLDSNQRLLCGALLGVYYLWQGNFARAAAVYDFLQAHSLDAGLSDLVVLAVKELQVVYLLLTAQCREAVILAREALGLAAHSGVRIWNVQLLGHGIWATLSDGELAVADEFLGQLADEVVELRRFDQATYHFAMGWRAMVDGQYAMALEHITLNTEYIAGIGFLAAEGVSYSCIAELMCELGRYDEAGASLARGYAIAGRTKSTLIEFFCLLADAQIAFATHDDAKGLELLGRAFCLGRLHGYRNKLLWRPSVMAGLCARALEAGIETDYAQELVQRRGLAPFCPAGTVEAWPWPVKVHILGRFDLSVTGVEVAFAGKTPRRPIELLKALIAIGGEERSEGELADLLWPEADGDTARSTLKSTLHRLRELLGNDRAILVRDGCLIIDRSLVWVDAWAFEQLLIQARRHAKAGERATAVRAMEKALDLFRGQFLNNDKGRPWSEPPRIRLRNSYISATVALADVHRAGGEFARAIERCQRGLEVDELSEELYQNLMESYRAAGLNAEALATFNRCRSVLAGYGIKPSEKTSTIRRSILAA